MSGAKHSFAGTLSVVSGGSKGIGRAAAVEIVRRGGSVLLLARGAEELAAAAGELGQSVRDASQFVEYAAVDATDPSAVGKAVTGLVERHGVPQYLFNFVGYACPDRVTSYVFEDFKRNMEINYYGQLVPILALLPHFLREGRGHIVNCASVAGYLGMMGYAAYAPTKFAVVGLTESLRNELAHRGVTFSLLFPPDTDTPGFKKENESKPPELRIISEGGGLLTPEDVARTLIDGVGRGRYFILPGQARILWAIVRHFPRLSHWILDRELAKALKKTAPAP